MTQISTGWRNFLNFVNLPHKHRLPSVLSSACFEDEYYAPRGPRHVSYVDDYPLFTYKSLPEHIKSFPIFLRANSYQNSSSFSPVLKFFPLSSKSIFLCVIPTRTHQVFALSSKYFPLSSKSFSYVQILPDHVKYFPSPPSIFPTLNSYQNASSIFPSPPSIFSCPRKRFGANNFKIIIEYLLRHMSCASLDYFYLIISNLTSRN